MTGDRLREEFLRYFEDRGHRRVRSSSLVPGDDPTLLFTNAGMVQFKRVFTGEEQREYRRATSCQKCVRAGGKHNDLENVGRTARHHTFFEMLGNFSFGDYFKADAIGYAWEFLTRDLGLDRKRLMATVFTDDDDAFALWKKVAGFGNDRILRLGEKDNFWAMGDHGPCGPCSEVHFHQGDHLPCAEEAAGRKCLGPACECDRWLEIWNLVFMQFYCDTTGTRTPLPRPSIDTGMGLERIAAVMQGKLSNYDTDLLRPLVDRVATLSGKPYGGADSPDDVSMRVIADHARATTFLIGDGVTPSNEWRGYVLRRIMRRAMRHGRRLGLHEPFLYKSIDWVAAVMKSAYPELMPERARIQEVVRQEEERFAQTLDVGMEKIEEFFTAQGRQGQGRAIDGKFLFTLYDTYGFPRDLAEEVLRDAGWRVTDATEVTWKREMDAQRERARAGAAFAAEEGGDGSGLYHRLAADITPVQFVGYETLTSPARILALVDGTDGLRRVTEVAEGAEVEVILDRTPAYAESAGSLVAPDHLRFDFSHGAAVKDREVEQIEDLVNEQVQANVQVTRQEMDLDEALRSGALALFGEKYGQRVAVIRIGDFSVELCGGTHLDQTGQIGLLKVASEGAVASGVRRVEAVAGPAALAAVARQERALKEAADILKISPGEVPQRLRKLVDEQRALEKQLQEMEARLARSRADELVDGARQVNGVDVIAGRVDGLDAEGLRTVVDRLRERLGSGIICVASVQDGRANLVAAVSKDLIPRFHAGRLIQEVAKAAGGSGGGRPELAQAGTKELGRVDQALQTVYEFVGRVGGVSG